MNLNVQLDILLKLDESYYCQLLRNKIEYSCISGKLLCPNDFKNYQSRTKIIFMDFFTQSRKYLNKELVKQAAEHLILSNGITTTLEVKKHLREQGYLAFQREVSRMLETISKEHEWRFEYNGKYRIYSFQWDFDISSAWGIPAYSLN